MPKLKTRKAAAKRFKFTATGKIKRRRAGTRHILEWKTSAQKRRLGKTVVMKQSETDRVRKMLPNG